METRSARKKSRREKERREEKREGYRRKREKKRRRSRSHETFTRSRWRVRVEAREEESEKKAKRTAQTAAICADAASRKKPSVERNKGYWPVASNFDPSDARLAFNIEMSGESCSKKGKKRPSGRGSRGFVERHCHGDELRTYARYDIFRFDCIQPNRIFRGCALRGAVFIRSRVPQRRPYRYLFTGARVEYIALGQSPKKKERVNRPSMQQPIRARRPRSKRDSAKSLSLFAFLFDAGCLITRHYASARKINHDRYARLISTQCRTAGAKSPRAY